MGDFRNSLRSVKYFMRTNFATVTQYAKLQDINEVLARWPNDTSFFAVVHRSPLGTSGVVKERLVGVISREHIESAQDWLISKERKGTDSISTQNNGWLVQQLKDGSNPEDLEFDLTSRVPGTRRFEAVLPLTVPPTTTLEDLAVLFVMHQCEVAWVTGQHGEVLGIVTSCETADMCKKSGQEMACSRWFSRVFS